MSELPRDVFPSEVDLREAIAIDELAAEINKEFDEDLERLIDCIMCRIDRLERSVK